MGNRKRFCLDKFGKEPQRDPSHETRDRYNDQHRMTAARKEKGKVGAVPVRF